MTLQSTKPSLADWWNTPDVKEARDRARYDETCDLRSVLEQLLSVVDEREVEKSKFPFVNSSATLRHTARCFVEEGGRVHRPPQGAIIQMLDIGADPARLKEVFLPEAVDRELARWRSWRLDVLNLARKDASGTELRAATPPGTPWNLIRAMLTLHGFDYPETAPLTPIQADAAEFRVQIMTEYQKGGTHAEVAERAGCTSAYVKALLFGIRHGDGLYAGLDKYLERAA